MSATPRPRVVTLACVFVGFSAFLLLLDLIQALSSWGTIEMQDALQPALTALNDRGLDVTMGELLGTLRWIGLVCVLLLVAATCSPSTPPEATSCHGSAPRCWPSSPAS